MSDLPVRFCIEETSFNLGSDEHLIELTENFTRLMVKLHDEDNQEIMRWSQLEFETVFPGIELVDLMYNEEKSPLDKELRILLIQVLTRCRHWDDEFESVEATFDIGGSDINGKSLAYIYEQVKQKRAVSCVCLNKYGHPVGCREVRKASEQMKIHFVTGQKTLLAFYRDVAEIESLNEKEFIRHGNLAFPQLYFVPDIDKQFRKFRQSYPEVRPVVTRHLSVLNDHFQEIYEECSYKSDCLIRRFQSGWDISISQESPKTKKNKKATRQREVTAEGIFLRCEWHTKLTPTYDRIHFHQGMPGILKGRIIIGIFAEHLGT